MGKFSSGQSMRKLSLMFSNCWHSWEVFEKFSLSGILVDQFGQDIYLDYYNLFVYTFISLIFCISVWMIKCAGCCCELSH